MNFKIITLGCKVNSYESQAMKEILIRNGYEESVSKEADILIVNSCAVTHVAEHKSRQKVSSLAKNNPNSIVIVCGCSSQLHPDKMKDIDNVAIVIGNNNHSEIISLIEKFKSEKEQIVEVDRNTRLRTYQRLNISSFSEKIRSFVKIGDGCNNFCSYCIIPYTRGNLRSRDKDEILCEIKTLVSNGYKEVVITGIDSASYGIEFEDYKFNDLLEDITKIENLKRLRISSIEASQMDERFINILKSNEVITPHLHIPLQSGSDTVLKRMRRKYTCDQFYEKVKRIQDEIPLIALACDVIVGFPGETEEEFMETYNFIKKCNFAFLHVFPYSPREGTYAATMKDQVKDHIKKERVARLINLGKELELNYKQKFVGKEVKVLIENYDKKKEKYHGLTPNYLDVYLESDKDLVNEIVTVTYKMENFD